MKILAIDGSPRTGNISFMLDVILDSAGKNGAETSLIRLREKKIEFCSGGDYCCPKTGVCVINDDMKGIYKEMDNADILILASPCYFSNVSAMMKNFMDRCNPYWFNRKLKGKKAFLIGTGGFEKSIKKMIMIMGEFTGILGMEETGYYLAKANKKGDVEKNQKLIKELKDMGIRLGISGE
ncbi:flavodoxin family protein [Candidatus Woesearchaeota archaeon]|nr:flavodoxin family protein [Candidatus Woesearchaeota archaeon]